MNETMTGWTPAEAGRAGTVYTRTLKDGTFAVAGNLSGSWGWDTFSREQPYADLDFDTATTSGEYETPEAMLADMRRLGLVD